MKKIICSECQEDNQDELVRVEGGGFMDLCRPCALMLVDKSTEELKLRQNILKGDQASLLSQSKEEVH